MAIRFPNCKNAYIHCQVENWLRITKHCLLYTHSYIRNETMYSRTPEISIPIVSTDLNGVMRKIDTES